MNLLALVVLLPLVVGTIGCYAAGRGGTPARRRAAGGVAGSVAAAAFLLLALQAPEVLDGRTMLAHTDWIPAIGLDLNLRLDALAWMFAMLITGMGLLVVLYAAHYLGADDPAGKFFAQLMLFMAAMLGIVLSDNLLLLLVFWDLTSISSFLLIGYWGHREASRSGARTALAVTGGGGLVLLAGVVVLGQIAGTFDLSEMLGRPEVLAGIREHALYPLALGLILVGCMTKSAQLPFHFWLPDAMAAPTPVSAYLHSATMVKAGLFLMMRLYPVLGGTALFDVCVASIGLLTMVFAAFVAVFRHDLKALLAYSTVSHLGLITFLIGMGSPLAMVAAVLHVLNHAAFKGALFMSAGIVDHEAGTRDMRRLGGLMSGMPVVGSLVVVAAAAMAGLPPLNGFVSKEMMLDAAVSARAVWGDWSVLVPVLATAGALFSAAYSLRIVHDVFFNGPPRDLPNPHPHEPAWPMKAPVVLLVAACILIGLVPAMAEPLVRAVTANVLGRAAPDFRLALWHGFNLPLALSLAALFGAVVVYVAMQRTGRLHAHRPVGRGASAAFSASVDALFGFAGRITWRFESGSLQRYLAWMIAASIVVAILPFALRAGSAADVPMRTLLPASPLAFGVWIILLALGIAIVRLHRQRFVAVVLAGGIGLVASVTFLALSAPDLALTQLSVDVVSTVLLMMGLALLPQSSPVESEVRRRCRDAMLALAGGGGIAWLTWSILTTDFDSISWYFLENSVPLGGGTNMVNVILVDFRGYDTFGEITVLGIAAVGVLALLQGLRVRRPPSDPRGQPWSFVVPPLMLRMAARFVLPAALVVTVYIFWRGHSQPGGGFIAGLVVSVALLLQYMALGQGRAEAILRGAAGRRFTRWIGVGLGIAWLTGFGATLLGRPFLTSAHGNPLVPIFGELPLASAALFDLGVFVTVVGSTLLMLSVLGAASTRSQGASDAGRGAQA